MAVRLVFASPAFAQTAGTQVGEQFLIGDTTAAAQSEPTAISLQPVSGNFDNTQVGLVPINVQGQVPINAQIQVPINTAANVQQVPASVAAELNLNVNLNF